MRPSAEKPADPVKFTYFEISLYNRYIYVCFISIPMKVEASEKAFGDSFLWPFTSQKTGVHPQASAVGGSMSRVRGQRCFLMAPDQLW